MRCRIMQVEVWRVQPSVAAFFVTCNSNSTGLTGLMQVEVWKVQPSVAARFSTDFWSLAWRTRCFKGRMSSVPPSSHTLAPLRAANCQWKRWALSYYFAPITILPLGDRLAPGSQVQLVLSDRIFCESRCKGGSSRWLAENPFALCGTVQHQWRCDQAIDWMWSRCECLW